MTSSPRSDAVDPMDPVRLQVMLTGIRAVLGELPARPALPGAGSRFRRTSDSPLFDGLARRSDYPPPTGSVSAPRLRPGGPVSAPLLNPVSLAAVIRRSRWTGST